MDLQQAIEWVHELGGSINFYGCSGMDVIGIRFYRHCNESNYAEYTKPVEGDLIGALVSLCGELSQKTRQELLRPALFTEAA